MLQKYAHCLKALNRKDEYVRVVLALLEKSTDARQSQKHHQSSGNARDLTRSDHESVCDDSVFSDLVQYSRDLPYEISVPMTKFFDGLEIDRFIQLYDNRDGFQVQISFCQLLGKEITADSIKARLISTGENHPVDFWLNKDGPLVLGRGISSVKLSTNVGLCFIVILRD